MAFPRKKSRRIHVDGHDLVWCVGQRRHEVHHLQIEGKTVDVRISRGRDERLAMGDRIFVQSASGAGAKLIVTLPWDWCDEPEVAPRHIAAWIQEALSRGWQPGESKSDLKLEGFAV